MIVLDASVLIGHFEPADAHHRQATELLTSSLSRRSTSALGVVVATGEPWAAPHDMRNKISAISL